MLYFVISDPRGHFDQMISALDEAGYDPKNEGHTLIILGDLFDRGFQVKEIIAYLESIDQSRLILIRGNHEDLFLSLLDEFYPDAVYYINGTIRTLAQLSGIEEEKLDPHYWIEEMGVPRGRESIEKVLSNFQEAVRRVLFEDAARFYMLPIWRDYAEIGDHILVHGFYPTLKDEDGFHTYDPDWRSADEERWKEARWAYGYEMIADGCFEEERKKGKTIVMGHTNTSGFFQELDGDYGTYDGRIYCKGQVVALDSTVYAGNPMNVYVFEN